MLFTDTVGFINNLPTLLIAAFRATLEEINEATVLMHVVDVTHPNAPEQMQTVIDVLEELGADDKPVVTALNKVDRLTPNGSGEPSLDDLLARLGPAADLAVNPVPISARDGIGFDQLLAQVEIALEEDAGFVPVTLTAPFAQSELVDRFHRLGRVQETSFDESGTTLQGYLPARELGRFAPYVVRRDGRWQRATAGRPGHLDRGADHGPPRLVVALIDLEAREIHAKIVYFGPELSGKTTTLRAIAEGVPPETRGAFRSIASESARTIFSDSLPIDLGERLGFRLHWHLYTVPGQPRSSGARAAVLQGVDGIVFVADSAPLRMAENMDFAGGAESDARRARKIAGELPGRAGVQQVRSAGRDAPGDLAASLELPASTAVRASAINGEGVFDALRAISKQVAASL